MTLSTVGNSYLVQTGYISLQMPKCFAYLLLESFLLDWHNFFQ